MPTENQDTYDIIVIGGGPVGENVAPYAIAGTDLTAAIVESHLMGGECSYYACIPSKTLLHPLDVAEDSRHLQGLTPAAIDPAELLARRDYWVNNYNDAGQVEWAEGAGIDVIRGHGSIAGDRTVHVTAPPETGGVDGPRAGGVTGLRAGGVTGRPAGVVAGSQAGDANESRAGGVRTLTARHAVVVASGSSPTIPPALQAVHPWTSPDATGVVDVPERLAIVGGGVVACEAARWMAALGSRVTILARSGLLGHFEDFCGEHVAKGLAAAGVEVRTGFAVTSAERAEVREADLGHLHGGPVTLGDGSTELEFDEVLAATGRRPNLTGLDLDPRPGWLHHVGDASGEAPLTHWGKYRARMMGEAIQRRALDGANQGGAQGEPNQWGAQGEAEQAGAAASPQFVPVPQVVFSSPQVAASGLTLAQAQERWPAARAVDLPLSVAGSALLRDDADGHARLVIDPDGVLRGATFVGPGVAELAHGATIAIVAELTVEQLRHAVPSFPTVSEIWLNLIEAAR